MLLLFQEKCRCILIHEVKRQETKKKNGVIKHPIIITTEIIQYMTETLIKFATLFRFNQSKLVLMKQKPVIKTKCQYHWIILWRNMTNRYQTDKFYYVLYKS
jgi:hypothetical protein